MIYPDMSGMSLPNHSYFDESGIQNQDFTRYGMLSNDYASGINEDFVATQFTPPRLSDLPGLSGGIADFDFDFLTPSPSSTRKSSDASTLSMTMSSPPSFGSHPCTPPGSGANLAFELSYGTQSSDISPGSDTGSHEKHPSKRRKRMPGRSADESPGSPSPIGTRGNLTTTAGSEQLGEACYSHAEFSLDRVYNIITQEKERIFQCDHAACTKKFKRPEHLRRHRKTHLDVRPFDCLFCERKFSRRDNLRAHYRSHSKPGGRNRFVQGLSVKTVMDDDIAPLLS